MVTQMVAQMDDSIEKIAIIRYSRFPFTQNKHSFSWSIYSWPFWTGNDPKPRSDPHMLAIN